MSDKNIANSELEVMRLLWRESPLTLAQIREKLQATTTWSDSTIKTFVYRLRDRGIITPLDKYGPAQFVPLVSEDEYVKAEIPPFINRVFEGNAKALVAALCRDGELTESDIDELKAYFKMGGGKDG